MQRHPRALIRSLPRKSASAASERRAELGKRAELAVSDYVMARGCTILHTNLRVGRLEIDLVARDGPVVAVIEVRTRSASSWQRGLDSVGAEKRARLRTAGARLWRELSNDTSLETMRFDIASVVFAPNGEVVIEYVKSAF